MFTAISITLTVLAAAATYVYLRVQKTRKTPQFYWNSHAGRLAILHRRYYEEFGGLIQDGTRSIGPPFRVSKQIFSMPITGKIMGLVTSHPWFVKDPNLFVPLISFKYYNLGAQEAMGFYDNRRLVDYEEWFKDFAEEIEHLIQGLGFWEKTALRFGEREELLARLRPESLYETRVYDTPAHIGGGLVEFRVELPHVGIPERFVVVQAGQIGWEKGSRVFVYKSRTRDPFSQKPAFSFLPLTEREAKEQERAGLATIYTG